MASRNSLYTYSFFCTISLLSLVSSNSLHVPNSLCFFERYIHFNVKRTNKPASWHQSNMIKQFTNYMIIRGMTCGVQISPDSSYCIHICDPLAHSETRLWLQSQTVRRRCQRPLCSRSPWLSASYIPSCGSISFSSSWSKRSRWRITLPKYLEFNLTIWEVRSKRYPLAKAKCKHVPHLVLWELDVSSESSTLRSRLCGITPIQNIVAAAQTVAVLWKSSVQYEEEARFCLSYQATAVGYARQYSQHYNRISPVKYAGLLRVKYFEDEVIDRNFNVDFRMMLTMISAQVFKRFATNISDENLQYRYFTGGVLHRVWSVTGSIYYVPQFTLDIFACAADNDNSIKRPTLEVIDHPLTQYDPTWQIQNFIIGPTVTCKTRVTPLVYNSSIGDLTIQLTTAVTDDIHIFGRIRYIAVSCPGNYCEKTIKNVSAGKGNRFNMTSHTGNTQQRLLIYRSDTETGFIAISNFSVRIQGPTHMPCYYGGLFIYELEPLTLVAKICTPWVAKAWHKAVKRADGTNGLSFNTRPILFVIKSYGQNFFVHLGGHATLSRCAGVVNAAFRDMHSEMKVSQNGEIVGLALNRRLVKHTNGCFQLSHVLTDGNYLTRKQTAQLTMFVANENSSNLANHTIEASQNTNMEASLNAKIERPSSQDLTVVFNIQGISNGEWSCSIWDMDLGFPGGNTFNFNKSFLVSLLPGRRSYNIRFSTECLVFGINPVVTMAYVPTLMHSCLGTERHLRSASGDEKLVTFPSLNCGTFEFCTFYASPLVCLTTHIIFNNPSFKSVCCALDLDIYLPIRHLNQIDSVVIEEHDVLTDFMLTAHNQLGFDMEPEMLNMDMTDLSFGTFNTERLFRYSTGIQRAAIYWACSSSLLCSRVLAKSKLHVNSSIDIRVPGRPWSVNTMHVKQARVRVINWNSFISRPRHFRMKLSFLFREWDSAAIPPVTIETARNNVNWNVKQPFRRERNHSYCYTEYGICYDFYETKILSWFEGEQFCRSEGKMLLSTPTDYEWEMIAALFAREPFVANLVNNSSLAFINLIKNEVCF